MEKTFTVTWEIDVVATTHRDAADFARSIQLDKKSTATFFKVKENKDDNLGETKRINTCQK